MEAFNERLKKIDTECLKQRILDLKTPCYESTLLNIAFPDMDISRANTLELYQNHFLLFHMLYKLQDEFFKRGQYLHVHFMRTMLIDYPDTGKCRFFEEELGRFCGAICRSEKSYCNFHEKQHGDNALEALSVKFFYLDPDNFYKLDKETAEAFVNGAWELLTNYEAYKNCFKVLNIPETSDFMTIKKAFRRLAKKYHPDLDATSHKKFLEINNAYQLLLHILPVTLNKT